MTTTDKFLINATAAIGDIETEYQRWRRAHDEIIAALRGDPVAVAQNHKEVERMRQRECEESNDVK